MSAGGGVQVRRLEPHETALHRELRLRALGDAPDSFAETFAAAATRPATYWEELTRSVTEPGRHVMFLAGDGPHVLGSVYGLVDQERPASGRVGGMWVEPAQRRHGIGRALLQAVFAWARGRGMRRLGLWAPAHNPAAIALYSSEGFRATGERRSLATDPAREIVAMDAEVPLTDPRIPDRA